MRRHALLVAPVLLLSGCFSYQEEVWIEPDGSGRASLDVFVAGPQGALPSMSLDERELGTQMGVTFDAFELKSTRRGVRLVASYRFDAPVAPARDVLGERPPAPHAFRWEVAGRRHRFLRNLPALGMGVPSGLGGGIVASDVPGFRYRTTVHFPHPVRESNATAVDGTTARWDVGPLELVEGKRMAAEAVAPVPVAWVVLGGAAVAGVLGGMAAGALAAAYVVVGRLRARVE